MDKPQSKSVSAVPADRPSHFRLDLPPTGSELPFSKLFVMVYEHLEGLKKNGHDAEAEQMDNSLKVAALIEIAEDQTWKAFDTIWSAKEFRKVLYYALAPEQGGPLWLRQALKIKVAEKMCMAQIPHVWKQLFDQAKDFTNVFVDPLRPGHAQAVQDISYNDMTKLKGLWSRDSGTLSLGDVEALFFPKASRTQRINRSSSSQVTGKTYSHIVKVLGQMDPGDYVKTFDRLARYAVDQTRLPPSVYWDLLVKVAFGSGLLTNGVLRHIMFWFKGHDLAEGPVETQVYTWTDLLKVGPFATRASVDSDLLIHADKSPDEAARLFIQALFDKIRGTDGVEHDWDTEAVKTLALQSPDNYLETIKFLSESCRQVCYRDRFKYPAWSGVVDLIKSYVGSQFQGFIAVYNEVSTTIDSQPQISLRTDIEQKIWAAQLQCMNLTFLDTAEASYDLASEINVMTAMYLYRHCKQWAVSRPEAVSSGPSSNERDNVQPVRQERDQQEHDQQKHDQQEHDQKVQSILKEAARVLQGAGFNPQPTVQDECLDRFYLQRSGFVLAESSSPNGSQPSEITNHLPSITEYGSQPSEITNPLPSITELAAAPPAAPTGTLLSDVHENLPRALAVSSIDDLRDSIEREENPRPSRKRRRN